MEFWYWLVSWLPFEWAAPDSMLFMKHALLAILVVTPLFGLLSTMVVESRMAFFSDALGHSAFTGMAIGAICGLADPVGGAVIFAIVIAFLFTLVRQKTRMASDTAISVFSSAAVALGIFISTMGGQSFTKFNSLLIGDILSVSPAEIGLLAVILVLVVVLWVTSFNHMMLSSVHQALADSRLLRGAELVNALYSKALKVDAILPEDFAGIWENLFLTFDELSYINGESPYADAVVPGMLGGRNLVSRNLAADNMAQYMRLEAIRTRLPYADQLMVGDVLMGELGPEEADRVMYLYTGDTMLNLLSGKEIEYKPTQDCLNPVMSYKRFVILRPSMLLGQQEQQS